MARIISFLAVALLLLSCDVSSPKDVAESEIRDQLDAIKTAFNLGDLDGIMARYHLEYYDDGDDYAAVELRWQLRLIEYDSLSFDDIAMNIDHPSAYVSGTMTLSAGNGDPLVMLLPDDTTELTWWQNFNGTWKILGRQY